MIRNVFLDLDNTLFDFTKAEHIALARTLRFGLCRSGGSNFVPLQ